MLFRSGELIKIGTKWQHQFKAGDKFSIQPALNYAQGPVGILSAPGYSYKYIGGNATYVIIPREVMEQKCLLPYSGEGYYPASLSEPLSCVIGAMHANYHTTPGSYIHKMDIKPNGNMAILAGVGPMGLAAINYAISRKDIQPNLIVVTDIDQNRLDRAASLYTVENASKNNIKLVYLNTSGNNAEQELMELTKGEGYDDVFVFAPVAAVIEQADRILAIDGCLNFFAGPSNPDFSAKFNFYGVHYKTTHVVGTSGGNNDDMLEALEYMSEGLDPAGLITHIGGLNAVIDTTMNLPTIPGGKKLIYNHIDMPLTAIAEFETKGLENSLYEELNKLCKKHQDLWNVEAENYLLSNYKN